MHLTEEQTTRSHNIYLNNSVRAAHRIWADTSHLPSKGIGLYGLVSIVYKLSLNVKQIWHLSRLISFKQELGIFEDIVL